MDPDGVRREAVARHMPPLSRWAEVFPDEDRETRWTRWRVALAAALVIAGLMVLALWPPPPAALKRSVLLGVVTGALALTWTVPTRIAAMALFLFGTDTIGDHNSAGDPDVDLKVTLVAGAVMVTVFLAPRLVRAFRRRSST